ncbi:MAG TPA: 2-phosphosulfolactate phosphatase [Candidatus Baltobacteraceae bacterium]|nr:2-phosphosulfolactate phosphatase [Candidatus Baltobacteraceae bacterium]
MAIARCDVSLTPSEIPSALTDTAVVVMDVLRATTTIVYALQSGAERVIPCEEPADALAMRERFGAHPVVLGGERDSVRIPGFDLDNSPLSYTREAVQGKTVAFTTTNGTRALHRAMQASPHAILCGAFVNLGAVVQRLLRMDPPNVLLACAGSEGAAALEDVLLAGAVADRLSTADSRVSLSDAAKVAALAYRSAQEDLQASIASSDHAQTLIRAGFADDVSLAAQVDRALIVPVVQGGEITAAATSL